MEIHNLLKDVWGDHPSTHIIDPEYLDFEEIKTYFVDSKLNWSAFDNENYIKLFIHQTKTIAFLLISDSFSNIETVQTFFILNDNPEFASLLESLTIEDMDFIEEIEKDSTSNNILYISKNNEGLSKSLLKINPDTMPPFWGKEDIEIIENLLDNPEIYGIIHIKGESGSGKSSYIDFLINIAYNIDRKIIKIPNNPLLFNDNELIDFVNSFDEPPLLILDDIDWMLIHHDNAYSFSPIDYIKQLLNKKFSWNNTGPCIILSSKEDLPIKLENNIIFEKELETLSTTQLSILNKKYKTKIKEDNLSLSDYWKLKNNIPLKKDIKSFGL